MKLNARIYTTTTCAIEVPEEFFLHSEVVPKELRSRAVDEYARLKDGLEVTSDQLDELFKDSDFAAIPLRWQEFLLEVAKLHPMNKVDTYMFCV